MRGLVFAEVWQNVIDVCADALVDCAASSAPGRNAYARNHSETLGARGVSGHILVSGEVSRPSLSLGFYRLCWVLSLLGLLEGGGRISVKDSFSASTIHMSEKYVDQDRQYFWEVLRILIHTTS